MEDIRFEKDKVKLQKSIKMSKFLLYLKRNWWKYLLFLTLLFLILFPQLSGHMLGSWWNDFATSFLQKLTF
jgi:hypothetical protein